VSIAGDFRIHPFPRLSHWKEDWENIDRWWATCPHCLAMFSLTEGKSLVGTADLRDAFNSVSIPKGIRCNGARLMYCDPTGKSDGLRNHQQLAFDCVNVIDNTLHEFTTDPLPPGTNVNAAAAQLASKVTGA
jgi:hypothetical protein